MGDRANIEIKQHGHGGSSHSLFLYSHWSGTELPMILQKALARKLRWDDEIYLARIIFCEMVKGQESDETGFGLSAYVGDGENRVLVVDCKMQTVRMVGDRWTFKEYIALEHPTWGD